MIVAKKSYNTAGNVAYDNNAYDYKRYTDNETREKSKDEKKAKHQLAVKRKLKLLAAVAVMVLIGTLIVGRYAIIMDLSGQSISLKNTISENKKNGDDLRIQLMKYCDIKEIEKYATAEIKMVRPDNKSIVHINIASVNDSTKEDKPVDKPQEVSLLGKIIGFFQ